MNSIYRKVCFRSESWLNLLGFCLALKLTFLAAPALATPPPGPTNVWTRVNLPGWVDGDCCESILVDPVNPGVLITACGNNDGRKIKWYRSTDYGDTWTLINNTAMNGNPWGFSIDPNPARDPSVPPTLYSPAGYGSFGIWKSVDGGVNWLRLAAADTAYAPYNPFGPTDIYHTALLPDDPPNHLLVTYHYGFKGNTNNEGGFGESWDGGQNWVIHQPPAGVGTSHYVIPLSATTWCVISQETDRGVWRTTTAGRIGGTAAQKYRDGTISTSAWTQVSALHAHVHGSYTPVKIGNAWYSPGVSNSEGSIWKSLDDGATWTNLVPGYTWPQPLNPYLNKNVTGLAVTDQYIYSNYFIGPEIARAPRSNETQWVRNYTTIPAELQGYGANPMGNASTKHAPSGNWLVFMATNNGVWRYIEPSSGNTIIPPSSAVITITVTDPIPLVAVSLAPGSASVLTGATQQFTATVTGSANTAVTWAVQEGSTGGTVNSSGLYTAPTAAGIYHVVAKSVADISKTATATVTVTPSPATVSYTTNFNLTASPISEGGRWHANAFGLIRSDIGQPALRASSTPVVTAGGIAHGTSAAASNSGFDDSWAILSGFPPDQSATAIIAKPNASGAYTEVELLLRFDDTGTFARGYECYISGYGQYLTVVRWNPDGTFTYLYDYGVIPAPSTGDVYEAKIMGTVITCKINNVILFQYDVATAASTPVIFSTGNARSRGDGAALVFATGNPGMGFDTDGNDAGFGFSSYTAKGL